MWLIAHLVRLKTPPATNALYVIQAAPHAVAQAARIVVPAVSLCTINRQPNHVFRHVILHFSLPFCYLTHNV